MVDKPGFAVMPESAARIRGSATPFAIRGTGPPPARRARASPPVALP